MTDAGGDIPAGVRGHYFFDASYAFCSVLR
ncbi:hypothetical protein SAMN04515691_3243 [Leifsonia sp. 98AMF]|nr:hypothetical protein SAMN04515684_3009 [Leifsonia sp. 466MF]SDN49636.1 hypothetical protein SAMN04515686_1194 [Leifsonia sp. 509MF]SFM66189.1 hypothetical protein SAMN04515691_3243 [Leifsonia sp. 98AMF]